MKYINHFKNNTRYYLHNVLEDANYKLAATNSVKTSYSAFGRSWSLCIEIKTRESSLFYVRSLSYF